MIFGLSLITWLKRDIINILDEKTGYISSTELTQLIGYASHSTIKKACKELQDDIRKTYSIDQVELYINKHHGMKLIRHTMNMQLLMEQIISTELVYDILQAILYNRRFSTIVFCQTYHISESQLRRKIKELNSYLNAFNLHITVSNEIKITGEEYTIRTFHFIFLFLCHKQFSKIFWITNKEMYLNTSKKIANYLGLEIWNNQLEILSISLFVNQNAIDKNKLINSYKDPVTIDCIDVPERPDFMSNWPAADWKFMLVSLYSADFFNFNFKVDLRKLQKIQPPNNTLRWIELFEIHFIKLDETQKTFIYEKFLKQVISTSIFELDEILISFFHSIDIKALQKLYPLYIQKFEIFWEEFSANNNKFVTDHFKIESLLTCIYIAPFNLFFQKIKIFIFSDLTYLYTNYIKERIHTYFLNHYEIIFTNIFHDADIIIGTIDFLSGTLKKDQEFIMISVIISINDLRKIDNTIKKFLKNKLYLQ